MCGAPDINIPEPVKKRENPFKFNLARRRAARVMGQRGFSSPLAMNSKAKTLAQGQPGNTGTPAQTATGNANRGAPAAAVPTNTLS